MHFEDGITIAAWINPTLKAGPGTWQLIAALDGEVLIEHPKQNDKLKPIDAPLMLGTEEPLNLNRFYNGLMDEFALFSRGLTQKEIKDIMGEIKSLMPVEAKAKLTTTWSNIRPNFNSTLLDTAVA